MNNNNELTLVSVGKNIFAVQTCNKLLWGFYFENYSMRNMAAMYGYRSADSVKTLKNRCMNRFEARMREV